MVVRLENSMTLGTFSEIQYVLRSSCRIFSTPIVHYVSFYMAALSLIELIESLRACGSRKHRLLICSRLQEHRACYRKTTFNCRVDHSANVQY